MLLWIIFAILTAATVALIVRPMLGAERDGERADFDVAVYEDQLRELERDKQNGLLTSQDAESARVEIARRLLAADEARDADGPRRGMIDSSRLGFLAVALLIPAISLPTYLVLGRPDLPASPISARTAQGPQDQSIENLVLKVEQRLAKMPEDGNGWDVVAPVYLRLGRHSDAVLAYRNAIRLKGERTDRLLGLGEALALANNGVVSEDSRNALARAVEMDPNNAEARFWLGLAAEQDGETKKAQNIYSNLLARAPENAPWRQVVSARLAMLQGSPEPASGPSDEDVRAASDISTEDRNQMIRSMVASLDERLGTTSTDVAAWERLVRSYLVLGEDDKAGQVLARARTALDGDAAALARLNQLASQVQPPERDGTATGGEQ